MSELLSSLDHPKPRPKDQERCYQEFLKQCRQRQIAAEKKSVAFPVDVSRLFRDTGRHILGDALIHSAWSRPQRQMSHSMTSATNQDLMFNYLIDIQAETDVLRPCMTGPERSPGIVTQRER